MIRRPPRSTLSSSSAASDVYKRQVIALARARRCRGVVAQVTERGSGCVPIRGFGPDPGVTRICRVTARGDRWAALRRLGDRYQATEAAADLAALTFRIRAEHRDRVLDIGTIAEASRLPRSRGRRTPWA